MKEKIDINNRQKDENKKTKTGKYAKKKDNMETGRRDERIG